MTKPLQAWGLALGCAIAAFGASAPCGAETPPAAAPQQQQDDAAASETAPVTPRIEFPVTTVDFGQKLAGEDLKTTFAFKNTGDAVLRILEVKGG